MMVSPQPAQLISCHLVEKDVNGDIIWAWSYPRFEPSDRDIFMRKTKFFFENGHRQKPFRFFRFNNQWVYIHSSEVFSSDRLPQVKQVTLILTCGDFNPERYETLCRVLIKSYCKSGHPPVMLKLFLSVMVTGRCTTEENGTFYAAEFDTVQPYRQHHIKSIISRFGLETILIYTALILKRRIVVYHHDVDSLIEFVLSLPAFLTHRDMWDYVFPWIDLHESEISGFKRIVQSFVCCQYLVHVFKGELPLATAVDVLQQTKPWTSLYYIQKIPYENCDCFARERIKNINMRNQKFFILGCPSSAVENYLDLYDVFVNVPASEISVAQHAKEAMTMTKTHKDIALFMLQLSEIESITERDVMQEIARKTKDLLDHLKSLGTETNGEVTISLEQLKKKEYSLHLEAFLFSLAQVENLAVI